MKFGLSLAVVALLVSGTAYAQDTTSEKGKLSYSIGFQIGKDFTDRKMDVDINTVVRAMQDAYAKRAPAVAEDKMRDTLTAFQTKMMGEAKAEFDKVAGANLAQSNKFMAENKTKKGIVSLPSGLQYRVIEDGTGKPVGATSEVIKGWQESLSRMKVGDHWQIFVPPEMAYGERGQPPRIGPNQALVFDIKVIDSK